MDAAPSPRTRLPRAERMEQTLAVAHALFAERGFTAVTMDDVAAAVGVTKPLLYNYFGNKERLYLACLAQSADALVSTVVDAVAAADRPPDALGDGIRAFFSFVEQDRSSWAVLFDETLPANGEIADRVAQYREQILDAVASASLQQFPAETREQVRVETEALSTAILGAVEALMRWWLRTEAITAHYAAELLIATIEPGLRQVSELPDTRPAGDSTP
ncbi:MAG: TetR/AcrR family transcriptional regulator [Solirubrobacteraceae bacterium]|nr:TetR/AcrR family transcriptional regulator [Solirubrobacteraceae bacterium]